MKQRVEVTCQRFLSPTSSRTYCDGSFPESVIEMMGLAFAAETTSHWSLGSAFGETQSGPRVQKGVTSRRTGAPAVATTLRPLDPPPSDQRRRL